MENEKIEDLNNEDLKLLIEEFKKENDKLRYQVYEKCEILEDMLESLEDE